MKAAWFSAKSGYHRPLTEKLPQGGSICKKKAIQSARFASASVYPADPWLKLEQDSEQTRQWTQQQNRRTSQWFDRHAASLFAQCSVSQPDDSYSCVSEIEDGFIARKLYGDETCAVVRLDPDFHETEVLVDSTLVPGFIYNVIPSPADSSILAIYTQNPQQEKPEFLLMDTRKQTVLQRFARCFSGVWSQQGDQFFFAELVPDGQGGQLSHIQVWHLLSGKRTLLYQETDSAVYSFVRTGGDALFVQTYLTYTQVKLTRISLSTGQIHLMNPGSFHNVNFIGTDQGLDYFTTDDQASRGRIIACPTGQDFRKANEVVPQQDRILQSACLVQGQLVCFYLNDGVCELCLIDPRHNRSCPIPLPDPYGTITLLSEIPLNIRSGSPFLFFQFQSFPFPPCILRLSVTARKVEPLQKIASHASFCVEKVAIAARDTTRLLAFLAYDPQQGPVESMPAIMYGYGGFAVCNTPIATNPVLHMDIAEWVRQGGLYIQCIVRGGGEFGEQWHQQGIGENKIHAMHDFIDIAQELIRRRPVPRRPAIDSGRGDQRSGSDCPR